jgi:hypothetical protein
MLPVGVQVRWGALRSRARVAVGWYQCSGLSFELDLIAQRDTVGAR